MKSMVGSIVYRAARKVMTLDVTAAVWLDRHRLILPELEPELAVRFLTPADVQRLALDPANDLPAAMAPRAECGRDFCMAVLCGDRLAAYAWFALGSIEAEHQRGPQPNSGVAVSFPSAVAFMYKGYTHPDFRGCGLYGAVVGSGLVALEPHGVKSVLSTMDWTNGPARIALSRIGFEELGLCWRWGWGDWMHTWAPRAARRRGASFGSQAVVEPRLPVPPPRDSMTALALPD